jgi:hypothetical protein
VAAAEEQHRHRRRHAVLLGVLLGEAVDHVAGRLHTALDETPHRGERLAARGDVAVDLAQMAPHPHDDLLDGLARGDLALGVSPDTVGDDVEPQPVVAGIEILVVRALVTDVGRAG